MNAGTESQHLDYKSTCDPSDTEARVKLAHDIACMAAHGGYLVIGVDGQGRPTGLLTAEQGQDFDEANLMPRIRQWLPPDVTVQIAWHSLEPGEHVALIHVEAVENGIVIMARDGQHPDRRPSRTANVVRFREGQIVTRNGTQNGVKGIILAVRRIHHLQRETARILVARPDLPDDVPRRGDVVARYDHNSVDDGGGALQGRRALGAEEEEEPNAATSA
jgi:hypothetical protein